MESIKELFKIGHGPSSSHTMGPAFAAEDFIKRLKKKNISFDNILVTLYSSLAWTGKGHLTDKTILDILTDYNTKVIFDFKTKTEHPNTLKFEAYNKDKLSFTDTYISIGGGYIKRVGESEHVSSDFYMFSTFSKFESLLEVTKMNIVDFINSVEVSNLDDYLNKVIDAMVDSVERGLKAEGFVAFELKVKRVAKEIYQEALKEQNKETQRTLFLTSFAYATSEENAAGGIIVTAPTAGSCGVLASLVYYYYKILKRNKKDIINALKITGLIGLIIKNEASISGAVAGCQAEIGAASSMGSAFCCFLDNMSIEAIGYAAEVSLEHSLGLTCDPVNGYVAIPCIERNAMGALRAYDGYLFSKHISKYRKAYVKFDEVIKVMLDTGLALHDDLKETSRAGLAKVCARNSETK